MINRRFPIVMMLEPLHACNLTCTGCGRIREYESTISERVPWKSVWRRGRVRSAHGVDLRRRAHDVPANRATGGGNPGAEQAHHPLHQRHVIRRRLHEFTPDKRFYFNVHLDGMEKNHDIAVEKQGVFRDAIEGIQAAKAAGFLVCTNTTVYKETDMAEIEELFDYLKQFDVDGHQISPAYGYSAVDDREIFMTRDDVHEKFRDFDRIARKYNVRQTPVYMEFLRGERELPCTAWGNPTYNIKGWKGPCYLITDGHYKTFEDLMTQTPWESYGPENDPRCEHCLMHCGFEPSAAFGINAKFTDNFKMLSWMLR